MKPEISSTDNGRALWLASVEEADVCENLDGDIDVDLVIVGGGFSGCAAALKAAELGASVALLEAEDIGFGGSGRNVGLVNAGLWTPPDDIVAQLGLEAGERLNQLLAAAPDRVFQLIKDYQIQCQATRNGTLHCAHSPSALSGLRLRLNQQIKRQAPVRLLDAGEAQQRVGSDAVHGALFDPRAGTIQPLGYCRGLARAARSRGAKVYGNASVQNIKQQNGRWVLFSGQQKVSASKLLLATNAYRHSTAGIPGTDYVPVYYFQLATEPLNESLRKQILAGSEGCWDTALIMSSWRLDAAGRLIIGAMGNLESNSGKVHYRWAQRKLAQLFPLLSGLDFTLASCGRIAMTSDHLPKIVEPALGAYLVFGYSGRGIGPGTVFGSMAAEALLKNNSSLLPLTPITNYRETLTALRGGFFESAALFSHGLGSRV